MKIAFDHQILGAQEYGGVSRYLFELATELATNCAQDVAVISPLYVNRYLVNAPKKLKVVGASVPRLPRTWRLYKTINSILSWPLMRCYNANIVHETYYSPYRIAPKKAKVVLTVYDMIHEKFSHIYPKNDTTSYYKSLAVDRADHVICISEHTRKDLIDLTGMNPSKISVVHLGYRLSNREIQFHKDLHIYRPFLLYVGNRGGYKNFKRLLQAYAASSILNENFDIISFGGGGFTIEERAMIQKLGIKNEKIRNIMGDDILLASYYSAATAFIYPSLYEGFGIPPLEAMNFDCPVVCSETSSIPEVVGNAAELFDPYCVDSIRYSIEKVVYDEKLKEKLIDFGRERLKEFSWQRCANETLSIYEKVSLL